MEHFYYSNEELYCEKVKIKDIEKEVGSPFYLYSHSGLVKNFTDFNNAFSKVPHIICYACKTNTSLAVARVLAQNGAGADIVSGGELYKMLKAGFSPEKIVFAGVGKTDEEIKQALDSDILMFNVESMPELEVIDKIAGKMKRKARIAFRINPVIDAKTHPYISTALAKSKFGISITKAIETYSVASELTNIEIIGIQVHLGSQIITIAPFVEALQKILKVVEELKDIGIYIKYINLGGGLGITYKDEMPPTPKDLAAALLPLINKTNCTMIFEPGRYISANAGILVSKVLYIKETDVKKFVVVDAAMNDLARPFLYDAHHEIIPVQEDTHKDSIVDVVGPVCESTDYFARNRPLPMLKRGDLIALMNSGAYGFVMSSNYNARLRVPEVMVIGSKFYIIRKRETYDDLVRTETIPGPLK